MYEKIKEMLIKDGACFVGCSHQEETPFPGLNYCISFGIKLSSAIVDTISEEGPSKTYFHHYRTVNTRLDQMALSAVIELERMGYNGANIPASQSTEGVRGLFSHKKAAVSAGLGWIGKSALFISRETGPLVRLATVFTDMALPVEEHTYEDGCKECDICKKMCVVWLGGHALHYPNTNEFNLKQDVKAAQIVFDSGVPLLVVPCCGVCTEFSTTVPELEYYLRGKNALCDYLVDITAAYNRNGVTAWSKVIWDVTAVAALVYPESLDMVVMPRPYLTNDCRYAVDNSRPHYIYVRRIYRDMLFADLFGKLANK